MDLPKIQYSRDDEDDEDEESQDELDITDNDIQKNNKGACDKSEFGISHIKVKYEEDEDDSD